VADVIPAGALVPFQIGLPSVKALVLGTVRDGEQYLLMIRYEEANPQTGQYEQVRRLFQRDVKFINSLAEQDGYIFTGVPWDNNHGGICGMVT
jgi:hypothetical protein